MKTYKLKIFDNPITWCGQDLSKDICNYLLPGDIVRLCLEFENNYWEKYYFEITKVDYYCYGGINKIRKYHGKVLKVYMESFENISRDHTTTWRRENILEIPGWKSENNKSQLNKQSILDFKREIQEEKDKYDDIEYDKRHKKEIEFRKLIKEYRLKYHITEKDIKAKIAKMLDCSTDQLIYYYRIGKLSHEYIKKICEELATINNK